MGLWVVAILIALLCKEASLVHGDIGTANSYNPPYTRKQTLYQVKCVFMEVLVFNHLLFLAATRCNGNRQDQFPPGNLFVSVSEGLWDNGAACGRRYRLRCLSGAKKPCKDGTVDVKVVDFCSVRPCPSTLLLSNDAFAAISHSPSMKINVEYIQ